MKFKCYSSLTLPGCLLNSCANLMMCYWPIKYLPDQCFLLESSGSYLLLKKFILVIATDYQKESVFIFDFKFDLSKIQALKIGLFELFKNQCLTFAFNLKDDYLKQTYLGLNSNNGQLQTFHSVQLEYFSKKSIYQHFEL